MVHQDGSPAVPLASSSIEEPIPPPPPYAPSSSAPPLHLMIDAAQQNGEMLLSSPQEPSAGYTAFHVMPTLNDMPPRGAKVIVTNLMSNYNLNGKEGVVTGFRSDGAVLVNIDGIVDAPIHAENLMWGQNLDDETIPAPSFMKPKMNTTFFEGMRIVRVRPPKRFKSDRTCCPGAYGWTDASFYTQLCFIYTSMLCAMISLCIWFVACFLMLVSFGRVAVLVRWMAHRHLDVLLTASPPRRGIVITHPTPTVAHGSCVAYACNGHTWRCFLFLTPISLTFSMISVMLGTAFVPVLVMPFIRPLYALACNVTSATLWLERSVAVCLLCHVVGEYDVVNDLLDESSPKARDAPSEPPRVVVQSYGAVAQQGTEAELLQDGVTTEENTNRTWLVHRQRTMEEKLAVERFYATFLKLFGRQPRLQDISIQPPRESGRGPRHFVTLGDAVDDADRLKLIKSYKQTFSTMYVHIVDIEEQHRQEGTDYSEMYS